MSLRPLPEHHRAVLLRMIRVALAGLREKSDALKRCDSRPKLRVVTNVEE